MATRESTATGTMTKSKRRRWKKRVMGGYIAADAKARVGVVLGLVRRQRGEPSAVGSLSIIRFALIHVVLLRHVETGADRQQS